MSIVEIITTILCVVYFIAEFLQLSITDKYRPRYGSKTFYWANEHARNLSTAIDITKIIIIGAILLCQFFIFM